MAVGVFPFSHYTVTIRSVSRSVRFNIRIGKPRSHCLTLEPLRKLLDHLSAQQTSQLFRSLLAISFGDHNLRLLSWVLHRKFRNEHLRSERTIGGILCQALRMHPLSALAAPTLHNRLVGDCRQKYLRFGILAIYSHRIYDIQLIFRSIEPCHANVYMLAVQCADLEDLSLPLSRVIHLAVVCIVVLDQNMLSGSNTLVAHCQSLAKSALFAILRVSIPVNFLYFRRLSQLLAGFTSYCTVSRSSSRLGSVCGSADPRFRLRVAGIVSIENGLSLLLRKARSRARSASLSSWGAAGDRTISGVAEGVLRPFAAFFLPIVCLVRIESRYANLGGADMMWLTCVQWEW
ncbi:hypothetical protein KC320_g25 [Hortaea werneckii]|nr:hypothetical protein KC320_g25 [Hortaea werneckii]